MTEISLKQRFDILLAILLVCKSGKPRTGSAVLVEEVHFCCVNLVRKKFRGRQLDAMFVKNVLRSFDFFSINRILIDREASEVNVKGSFGERLTHTECDLDAA